MAARKKLPKDPEAIRKLVLADPNTAQIAKNLGVPLEDYVSQVVHFATHPDAEPNLYIAEDADLRSVGWEPPDPDAMGRYLIEAVQVAEAATGTAFSDQKKKLVDLPEAPAATGDTNPDLKAAVDKKLKANRGRKG